MRFGPIEAAATSEELLRLARHLPERVYLGTSSWAFPGWQGLVYGGEYAESRLARQGLAAYGRHPLLRAVGIDRGYYQALDSAEWARTAREVPERFRFLIKAPAAVTDAVTRGGRHAPGRAVSANPRFLDPAYATERFVIPALEGLGEKTGPLVLQFAPMPAELTRDSPALIERIAEFLVRLPASHAQVRPIYAVELRNPELLTPRFVHRMREVGARLCVGIHPRMPPVARQAAALRTMDAQAAPDSGWSLAGPLVVRWSLHGGFGYEQARSRYAPFNRRARSPIAPINRVPSPPTPVPQPSPFRRQRKRAACGRTSCGISPASARSPACSSPGPGCGGNIPGDSPRHENRRAPARAE